MKTTSNPQPAQSSLGTRADHLAILGLTCLWIVLALAVDPRGDFPLLDDWSYGRSVKVLIEQGKLYYDGWNSPTLFLQVLYGALFCLPFGFSFETLRLSTLVAGLAGGLGTYTLLREISANRIVAVIGSLTVMLSPDYFQHSFTFMTDVPFAALSVIAAAFFVRSLRTGSVRALVLGTVIASGATLIRQLGIAIPLGYALALLATSAFRQRVVLRACLPIVATVAVLMVYQGLIDELQLTPALQGAVRQSILASLQAEGAIHFVLHALKLGEALFAHISLFVLPFLLVSAVYSPRVRDAVWSKKRWLFVLTPVLIFFLYWRFWPPALPVRVFGVMHSVVAGQRPWGAVEEPMLFRQALWAMELAATALMIFFLASIAIDFARRRELGTHRDLAPAIFGLTTSAAMLAPFMLDELFMERYLIPVIPFVLLTLVALAKPAEGLPSRGSRVVAAAGAGMILMSFGAVSVLYAHDHLLWNRVRNDAVVYLVRKQGVDPGRIDGGLTVNGWHLFDRDGPLRRRYINWRAEPGGWWRNEHADFVIGISRHNSSQVVAKSTRESQREQSETFWQKRYAGWLPAADGSIVICQVPKCSTSLMLRRSSRSSPDRDSAS